MDNKFIDIIDLPTHSQTMELSGSSGFVGYRGEIGALFADEYCKDAIDPQLWDDRRTKLKNTVSTLLEQASPTMRYKIKSMIINTIRDNLSYTDQLTLSLQTINDPLRRKIVQTKIDMMYDKQQHTVVVPTQETTTLSGSLRPLPSTLPNGSLVRLRQPQTFVKHIHLEKQYNAGEYKGLFSGISESELREVLNTEQ